MLWGYQNGWFPEFLTEGETKLWSKLLFLKKYGFKNTAVELEELTELSRDEMEKVAAFVRENDLHIEPSVWYDYVNSDDSAAQEAHDAVVAGLEAVCGQLRSTAVFTRAGCGHRFDGKPPVQEKIRRLSDRLSPLAKACKSIGTPLGINNQGDFYIDDFCQLADGTDDLFLWIDTSNIFWACEPIFPAFERAAERTIGTHWRDEKIVIGNRKPRGVMLENCTMGDGDVDLRRCFRVLQERAPKPEALVMQIELFPESGADRVASLERTLSFCRELTGGEL
jgi:sugar phosphate isomerase/epimerase